MYPCLVQNHICRARCKCLELSISCVYPLAVWQNLAVFIYTTRYLNVQNISKNQNAGFMDIYWCSTYLETFLDLSVSLSICIRSFVYLVTIYVHFGKETCFDLVLIATIPEQSISNFLYITIWFIQFLPKKAASVPVLLGFYIVALWLLDVLSSQFYIPLCLFWLHLSQEKEP